MEALSEFSIPVHGLKFGEHHFHFTVDWQFFRHFEGSPLEQGRFDVEVLFAKESDHWLLSAGISGQLDTDCDRCLAPISLPVNGHHVVFVKFEEEVEEERDPDIVYLSRDLHNWNIAQYLYEFILLSVPVKKVYDCEKEKEVPCDKEVLDTLEKTEANSHEGHPAWDVLKKTNWKN